MRIVAYITDPVALKQILQSLGLPQFTAPPKLRLQRFLGKFAACN